MSSRIETRDGVIDSHGVEVAPSDWVVNLDTPEEFVEAELIEGTLISPPEQPPVSVRASVVERRPIIPAMLRSRAELGDYLSWASRHYGHTTAYHLVRVPLYVVRVLFMAPVGAVRGTVRLIAWWSDSEGRPLRHEMVRVNAPKEYLVLSRQRLARIRWRSLLIITATLAAVVTWVLLQLLAAAEVRWGVYVALVLVVARLGATRDRPLIDHAVIVSRARRLTDQIVVEALIAAKLAKGPDEVAFKAPIQRDGPGWLAVVDLAPGTVAATAGKVRAEIASGLDLTIGQVWPERPAGASERRLHLWVGDEDLAATRPSVSPLVRMGSVDLFEPVPFGRDPRGRAIEVPLMFSNVLIGAMPRQGKTFALRNLALAAALDPSVELRIWELKGTGDLDPLEPVAHEYGSGQDDQTIARCLDSLRAVRAELGRRTETLKKLDRALVKENKITREVASRRDLGLHPLALIIDECQELFSHPQYGKEAGDLAERIIKLGPAVGVILFLATQRPDKDSLPTGVSANVGIRFCLRVMGQVENDMVLGTSSYRNGLRATTFTLRDKGIGFLVGAGVDPIVVRGDYIDAPTASAIVERARMAREGAGRLTGHAAGQVVRPAVSVLDDVRATFRAGEARLWSETILERLVEVRPGMYDTWKSTNLAGALSAEGNITTRQIKAPDPITGKPASRRGVYLSDLPEPVVVEDVDPVEVAPFGPAGYLTPGEVAPEDDPEA